MKKILLCLMICLIFVPQKNLWAAGGILPEKRLEQCIKKADKFPDMAFAEAEVWQKENGGDRADTCWAFAQFQRGEYAQAAHVFSRLAGKRDLKNRKQAASFHVQAALAYMHIGDHHNAEEEFSAAVKLEPQDPEIWVDWATERASAEYYWDAMGYVNRALKIMPDMSDALRLRGQIWKKLGYATNAKADFERATLVESTEGAAK